MAFEPMRRQVLRGALGALAASCLAGYGRPAAATPGRNTSRPERQARDHELVKTRGKEPDKRVLVGQQLFDNYEHDASAYHVPDRAAVMRMHDALVRQRHARLIGAGR